MANLTFCLDLVFPRGDGYADIHQLIKRKGKEFVAGNARPGKGEWIQAADALHAAFENTIKDTHAQLEALKGARDVSSVQNLNKGDVAAPIIPQPAPVSPGLEQLRAARDTGTLTPLQKKTLAGLEAGEVFKAKMAERAAAKAKPAEPAPATATAPTTVTAEKAPVAADPIATRLTEVNELLADLAEREPTDKVVARELRLREEQKALQEAYDKAHPYVPGPKIEIPSGNDNVSFLKRNGWEDGEIAKLNTPEKIEAAVARQKKLVADAEKRLNQKKVVEESVQVVKEEFKEKVSKRKKAAEDNRERSVYEDDTHIYTPEEEAGFKDMLDEVARIADKDELTPEDVVRMKELQDKIDEINGNEFDDMLLADLNKVDSSKPLTVEQKNAKVELLTKLMNEAIMEQKAAKVAAEKPKTRRKKEKKLTPEEEDLLIAADLEKMGKTKEVTEELDKALDQEYWDKKLKDEGMGIEDEMIDRDVDVYNMDGEGDYLNMDGDVPVSLDFSEPKRGGGYRSRGMGFMGSQYADALVNHAITLLKENPTVQNLTRVGKGLYIKGVENFGEFRIKMKEVLGDVYDKVSHLMREAYAKVKEWNEKLGESGQITWHGTKERFDRFLDEYIGTDENIPKIVNTTTLDMFGMQTMYEMAVRKLAQMKANREMFADMKRRPEAIASDKLSEVTNDSRDSILYEKPSKGPTAWEGVKSWLPIPMVYRYLGTAGEHFAVDIISAGSYMNYHIARGAEAVKRMTKGLSVAEQENLRVVMEGGRPISAKAAKAAVEVSDWLRLSGKRYTEFMRRQFKENLKPEEYMATMDVIEGADMAETLAKYNKDKKVVSPTLLKELVDKYQGIGNWKINDYIPNVELGTMRLLDKDGQVIAVAMTRTDAVQKLLAYKEKYEAKGAVLGDVYLDTESGTKTDFMTSLNDRAYYATMGRLSNAVQAQIEGINKGIANDISKSTMRGNFVIKPTSSFSEFALERRDILLGEKNLVPVLMKYSRQMEKKMALDPMITRFKRGSYNIPKDMKQGLINMIEDTKGKYSGLDKNVDMLLNKGLDVVRKKTGIDLPAARFTATKVSAAARSAVANTVFMYRPIAGIVNGLGGLMKIWIKTSADTMLATKKFRATPEGAAVLEELRPRLGTDMTFDDSGKPHTRIPMWKPTGMFQYPEVPVREMSGLANYLWAKDKLKYDHTMAMEYAIKQNMFQQCIYHAAALPEMMRGPLGRTATQFKPYLLYEIPFILSLRGIEIPKYTAGFLATAGPRGLITIMKSIPFLFGLGAWAGWDDSLEWMNKNFPRTSRGLGGALGVDVTAPTTFQFPTTAADWMGPLFSNFAKLNKLIEERASGVQHTLGTYGEWAAAWVPEAKNLAEVVNTIFDANGDVRNEKGEVQYNLYDTGSPEEERLDRMERLGRLASYTTKKVIGAQTIEGSVAKVATDIDYRRDIVERKNKVIILDKVSRWAMERSISAKVFGQGELPEDVWEAFGKMGLTAESIKKSEQWKAMTPQARAILGTELRRRGEVAEGFPDPSELHSGPGELIMRPFNPRERRTTLDPYQQAQ